MSLGGVCIFLVGIRDLSDAWQDGTSTRPAVETMAAGLSFVGVVVLAMRFKNRRRRKSKPVDKGLLVVYDNSMDRDQPGRAATETKERDRYDDVIDDELSKL